MLRWIDIGYMILLGITLGVVVALGAFVAPVVFHANDYIGENLLSHFQMGLIMTAIFVKANYLLNCTAVAIVIRESYDYKRFIRDRLVLPSAATAVLMIFLFTLYYTKQIVAFQAKGSSIINDPLFQSLHKASEIDFGLLGFSLLLLLGRRLYLQYKG
ncbi:MULTISPECIES: DUF4149 domain-containing protein [unclassified Nitratiruptor]|uniref:DUF4149 domain-containing protein n=1 Tax=unclassified Nitratiruptor TaxID=2624044 RepID=UPI001915C4A0|nr:MULTISPECIES: DUF4149 domain-containing protein [unclassified Nitratiruptor]BCD60249.1 hypothetical protein NitYY0810_C1014 [Nitratiruptor sp. YY08-10]BCD64262.1 hypothetical protein NitYY0814_C1107 [Nitratiruptor sp. YY08-14]